MEIHHENIMSAEEAKEYIMSDNFVFFNVTYTAKPVVQTPVTNSPAIFKVENKGLTANIQPKNVATKAPLRPSTVPPLPTETTPSSYQLVLSLTAETNVVDTSTLNNSLQDLPKWRIRSECYPFIRDIFLSVLSCLQNLPQFKSSVISIVLLFNRNFKQIRINCHISKI